MNSTEYKDWLESKPKCQRCKQPILRENYKGANFFARIFQEEIVVKSKFRFAMERIDITKPHYREQTRWLHTEFDLCNPCANDVMDYAQGKDMTNE